MRVLQIIPTLDRGGAEKQLTLLAAGLRRAEIDVRVLALTRGGPLEAELGRADVPCEVIGKSWKFDPRALWRLTRRIRELKPDLVHTWLFAANSYGRWAAWRAGVRRLVAGERCVDPWKSWELTVDRYLAKRTMRIVTNSSGVRDFYVNHGLPAEKFTLIPNGISPAPAAAPYSRAEFLESLGLPSDVRLVGAVGRLWPQKRYKDLIWAADLLKVIRDDTHLLISGEGPQRWHLERFRDQCEVQDRVHFLGHREDVPRWLPLLDCFWLGSGYEGQSNSLMEAIAAGVPVVVSDIAGNRDLVESERTGLLFPVGDRAMLARQTRFLLENPQEARALAEAARHRLEQEFSVSQMVARHLELYRQLLAADTP